MNAQIPPLWNVDVPDSFAETDCNEVSRFPFGYEHPATVRYQQVYNASAFAKLPPGGAFLSWINFRSDCSSNWGPLVTNVQIFASTTARAADQLSAVFAENVGPDETRIHRGRDYVPPDRPGFPSCPNPASSGNPIILDTPFFYDPARGNLLLEFRVSGVAPYPDEQPPSWWTSGEGLPYNKLDAQHDPEGMVSRAAALSVNATTADLVEMTGLWTYFLFAPTPSLEVTTETNEIVLSWSRALEGFRLQSNDKAELSSGWQDYAGETSILGWYKLVRIPKDALATRRFYRLALDTAQPLPEGSVSETVEVNAVTDP
jgi:hypothetical protein